MVEVSGPAPGVCGRETAVYILPCPPSLVTSWKQRPPLPSLPTQACESLPAQIQPPPPLPGEADGESWVGVRPAIFIVAPGDLWGACLQTGIDVAQIWPSRDQALLSHRLACFMGGCVGPECHPVLGCLVQRRGLRVDLIEEEPDTQDSLPRCQCSPGAVQA